MSLSNSDPGAPHEAGHISLLGTHVPVSADANTLPVVRGDQDSGVVQEAALFTPAQKLLDLAVGGLDLGQVLGVVAAPGVAGLIHAEQLQGQQVRVTCSITALALATRASSISSLWVTAVTVSTSSPKASTRWAIPTSFPDMPDARSESKMDSHFTPRLGTKLLRIPWTLGGAPVNMELNPVTVRAGWTVEVLM